MKPDVMYTAQSHDSLMNWQTALTYCVSSNQLTPLILILKSMV